MRRHLFDLGELVRGDENRRSAGLPLQAINEFVADERIEAGERLIAASAVSAETATHKRAPS